MRINGEDYEPLGNISVIDSLASEYNTLPKYLRFYYKGKQVKNLQKVPEGENIEMVDILGELRDSDSTVFSSVIAKLRDTDPLDTVEELLLPWMAMNEAFLEEGDMMALGVIEDAQDLGLRLETRQVEQKVLQSVQRQLNAQIAALQERVERNRAAFDEFTKIRTGTPHSNFALESIELYTVLDITEVTIPEIFDSFVPSNRIPFASIGEYYKIRNSFFPPEEWESTSDEVMIVKIGKLRPRKEDVEYSDILIFREDGQVKLFTEFKTGRVQNDFRQYLDMILSHFQLDLGIRETNVGRVNGIFQFPDVQFNRFLLADMIMNDRIFSAVLSIDEHETLAKQKKNVFVRYGEGPGILTASILVDEKSGQTQVKVSRTQSIESAEKFADILGKLFILYGKRAEKIEKTYQKFIPDFRTTVIEAPEISGVRKSQQVDPELFPALYTRHCPRPPIIVSENDDKNEYDEYLLFPREGDYGKRRYYVCDDPEKPYIYLRRNPFAATREKYPCVPCCAASKTKGLGNRFSDTNRYLQGDPDPCPEKQSSAEEIVTSKILDPDQYGQLSEELSKLLALLSLGVDFGRLGVTRTTSSFLSCILRATAAEVLGADEVNEARLSLVDLAGSGVCKQEMFDSSPEQIAQSVEDLENYLDPRKYINLLQLRYNCRIIVFSPSGIVLPYYNDFYVRYNNNAPVVLLYEHMGSESDRAVFPQCEIIYDKERRQGIETEPITYPANSPIIRGIDRLLAELNKYHLFRYGPVGLTELYFGDLEVTGQLIDPKGKCRGIQFNGDVGVYTEPIAPLAAPMLRSFVPVRNSGRVREVLGDFIESEELVDDEGQIVVRLGDVRGHVEIGEKPDEISYLEMYNSNKKMARYLTEYCLWLFSRFVAENDFTVLSDEVVNNFYRRHMVIDEDAEYSMVSRFFSQQASLIRDGKLLVTSEEMAMRLLYVVRQTIVFNREKIYTYKDRDIMDNFYTDISDFASGEFLGFTVLKGVRSFNSWVRNRDGTKVVGRGFQNMNTPYFVLNKALGSRAYLANNASDLEDAKTRADIAESESYLFAAAGTDGRMEIAQIVGEGGSDVPDWRRAVMGEELESGDQYFAGLLA